MSNPLDTYAAMLKTHEKHAASGVATYEGKRPCENSAVARTDRMERGQAGHIGGVAVTRTKG